MAKTQVYFVELSVPQKVRYICDIVEKFYNAKRTVAIFVKESKDALLLDQQLWVWKPDSFVPHAMADGQSQAEEETVTIVKHPDHLPAVDALIQFDPIALEHLDSYKYVIDFAETYHNSKLLASRERYRKVRDAGTFDLEFMKLGTFLALDL